uniref:Uncharacterized protein n=1 Tax=Anopheles arabiensis TaxID=7173 RepID=A0A182IEV5_ANOAR
MSACNRSSVLPWLQRANKKKRRKIVKQKSVRFSAVYPLQQPAVRVVVE